MVRHAAPIVRFIALALAPSLLGGCGAAAIASAGTSVIVPSTMDASIAAAPLTAPSISEADVCAIYLAAGRALVLSDTRVETGSDDEAGAMASQGGSLTLSDVHIVTSGTNSIPLAIGSGGGTIAVGGGKVVSCGADSPCMYCRGSITVRGGVYEALRSEIAVIEGRTPWS